MKTETIKMRATKQVHGNIEEIDERTTLSNGRTRVSQAALSIANWPARSFS